MMFGIMLRWAKGRRVKKEKRRQRKGVGFCPCAFFNVGMIHRVQCLILPPTTFRRPASAKHFRRRLKSAPKRSRSIAARAALVASLIFANRITVGLTPTPPCPLESAIPQPRVPHDIMPNTHTRPLGRAKGPACRRPRNTRAVLQRQASYQAG